MYIGPGSGNGYCSRGACHRCSPGEDAVTPLQLLGMGSIPPAMQSFTPMVDDAIVPPGMNSVNNGNTQDPNEGMEVQRALMMRREDVPTPTPREPPVIQGLAPRGPPRNRSPKTTLSQINPNRLTWRETQPHRETMHHLGSSITTRVVKVIVIVVDGVDEVPGFKGPSPSQAIPSNIFGTPPSDSQGRTSWLTRLRLRHEALATFGEYNQAWKSEEAVFGSLHENIK